MTAKATTISSWQQTRAALRALGFRAGLQAGDRVGLPLLIAALAKTVDPGVAAEVLASAGVSDVDVEAFLGAVPDIDPADVDRLPELKANTKVAKVVKGDLAGFVGGKSGSEEALRIVLSKAAADRDVRRFLADPTIVFGTRAIDPLRSTGELVRALVGYYQSRFHAGYCRYVVGASRGYSDFMDKDKAESFEKVADALHGGERQANRTVFASCLYDRSPLGACRQEYGELEAHILGAAILSEMTLVAQGPLSVSALTWAVDPCRYHRLAGLVLEKVAYLRDEGLLEVHPDDDLRLHSHVLPASSTMNNWLAYLREADPIIDEDIKGVLDRTF